MPRSQCRRAGQWTSTALGARRCSPKGQGARPFSLVAHTNSPSTHTTDVRVLAQHPLQLPQFRSLVPCIKWIPVGMVFVEPAVGRDPVVLKALAFEDFRFRQIQPLDIAPSDELTKVWHLLGGIPTENALPLYDCPSLASQVGAAIAVERILLAAPSIGRRRSSIGRGRRSASTFSPAPTTVNHPLFRCATITFLQGSRKSINKKRKVKKEKCTKRVMRGHAPRFEKPCLVSSFGRVNRLRAVRRRRRYNFFSVIRLSS